MANVNRVLVVGGGVGGLSLGISLGQIGIRAEIVEIQPYYNVYGVGIIQPSNQLRALGELGAADKCMELGSVIPTFYLCTPDGHVFMEATTPPLGRFPANNGIPRNVLHNILLEAALAHGATVRLGTTVQAMENHADGVNVTFTDGTTGAYDLVIGADGIHSVIRRMIFGDAHKPQYLGQSVWRAVVKRPAGAEAGYWYYGKHSKTGLVPMTRDTMYLALVSMEGDNPRIADDELLPRFRAHFQEYSAPFIQETLAQITDGKQLVYRPLETLLMPNPWYVNRALLIGDAAHGTAPQLGQGASIATEDAVVLAQELQHSDSVETALQNFMTRRFERCKMIVDVSKTLVEWEKEEWLGIAPPNPEYGPTMGQTLGKMMQPI
jgi:2-polyprenyl-6-methoxyphenol hydroxylase-like FAD-dependent oxidoreductase